MQNDLISRSDVIETIWNVFNSYGNDANRFTDHDTEAINSAFKVLQKEIEYIDIAYDVEEVVEKLEKANRIMMPVIPTKEAIEIVRNGGKE